MKRRNLGVFCSLVSTILLTTGCDVIEGMFARRSSDSHESQAESGGSAAPRDGALVVDDTGTWRLPPPNDLQQREGAQVSTTDRATVGAKSPRPGNNWIYDTKSKSGGFFLVSTPSAPNANTSLLRRIDLKKIEEHDYDPDTKGKQGAFVFIPDAMKAAVPSKYINGEGLLSAPICAMVPGPDKTVIAMISGTSGGVALTLNPYEDAQAFTPLQATRIPFGSNPCRAVYSTDLKKLYIVDVVPTEKQNGQQGIFVADIYNDGRATTATYYAPKQTQRLNSHSRLDFQAIELYNDALYLLSGNGRFDAENDVVLYKVPLNKAGEPLFDDMIGERTHNPIHRADHCPMSPTNLSAVKALDIDGKPRLLTSGTDYTVMWDIASDMPTKIDANPQKPGTQNIDTVQNGQGGNKFEFAPDGKDLFLLPRCRSHNKVQVTSDYVILGMNLTAFSTKDLSQKDPVDMAYQGLHKSLKNAKYHAQTDVDSRDFAVSPKYIGVTGSFNAGGDLMIIDRAKKTNLWFHKATDMKTAHAQRYGFIFGQDDPKFKNVQQNAQAIIWVP